MSARATHWQKGRRYRDYGEFSITWIMPIRPLCRRKRNGPGHWRDRAVGGGIFRGCCSEVLEELQELVRRLVAFLLAAGRGGFPDGLLLLVHVGMEVGLGAGQGFVT